MTTRSNDLIARRLSNQRLTTATLGTAADVVAWLGAVQAQEYAVAKWGISLRARGLDDSAVEQAVTDGSILRTHIMRPTWHFVTPGDIRWMLTLTGPRVNAMMTSYDRKLELDARVYSRSHDTIARALEGGRCLTRAEIAAALDRAGITARGQRLAHIVMRAEQDQVICSGPRRGKQFTYALLDERAPRGRRLDRDEAIAELARRYFTSHGPATARDFSWWSGLTMKDARLGIELVKPALASELVGGLTYWSAPSRRAPPPAAPTEYLLPIYDEYLIAYQDRELVASAVRSKNLPRVTLDPFAYHLVIDGVLAGHWRRLVKKDETTIAITAYRKLSRDVAARVRGAAERFGTFLGQRVAIVVESVA